MIVNEGGGGGKKLPELSNPGAAGDALSGKQFIDQNGEIVTGTIASKSDVDVSVSGRTVTIPAGHYPSQVAKSIASATQATPSISVNSSGLITASATQNAGYVASGTKSATRQLTTQSGKTVTPGTSQQTAVASERYTTGAVYVAGSSNLVASNIKKGVNIFGVTGTLAGKGEKTDFGFLCNGLNSKAYVYTDTAYDEWLGDGGYYSFARGDSRANTCQCTVGSLVTIVFTDNYDRIDDNDVHGFELVDSLLNYGVFVYACTSPNGTIRVTS